MANFVDTINSEKPVLVDFHAEWCGPCKMMAPVLEELSGELNGAGKIIKVDIDKNQNAARKYQIQSVPTLILFKKGQIIWRHSGTAGKEQLRQIINSHSA
ncbi:MAG: thioredoxin 1 [Cyclobacteriaceae bacterium]|jgi:thioredoxin 1